MTGPTYIDKLEVIATLRSRNLPERADWVDRELPALIDTMKNAALLRTLGLDHLMAAPSPEPAPGAVAAKFAPMVRAAHAGSSP